MLQATTIKFLNDLQKNNAKEWFDANRPKYENAKLDFAQLVQTVIDEYGKDDITIAHLQAKECMFRINRDVRFSKDKSPYKTNFGASINSGGKKSMLAGYYLHCQPGQSFVGGGIWMPMAPELKKVRQEIDYNFADFKKIIQAKTFKNVYGELYAGDDIKLSSMPKGYDKENPAANYLKLKSFLGMQPLTDDDLQSKQLTKKVVRAFKALQPLIIFINHAITE